MPSSSPRSPSDGAESFTSATSGPDALWTGPATASSTQANANPTGRRAASVRSVSTAIRGSTPASRTTTDTLGSVTPTPHDAPPPPPLPPSTPQRASANPHVIQYRSPSGQSLLATFGPPPPISNGGGRRRRRVSPVVAAILNTVAAGSSNARDSPHRRISSDQERAGSRHRHRGSSHRSSALASRNTSAAAAWASTSDDDDEINLGGGRIGETDAAESGSGSWSSSSSGSQSSSQSSPLLNRRRRQRRRRHRDDDGLEEDATAAGDTELTVRERQARINAEHPFGLRLWKPALYKKQRGIDLATERDLRGLRSPALTPAALFDEYGNAAFPGLGSPPMSPLYATEHGMNGAAALAAMEAGHSAAPSLFQSPRFGPGMADVTEATGDASAVLPPPPSVWSPWNLVWALLVGIPLALATIVTAFLVLVSTLGFGYPITHRLFHVARFWVWPFGCNLVKLRRIPPSPLLSPSFAIHRAWVLVFLGPIYLAAAALAWVSVLFVPMAKAVQRVLVELWRDPLGIMVGGRGMVPVTVDRGAPLTTVANDAHGATATTPLLVSSPPSAMMYGTEPPSSMADEYDPSLILLNISRAGGFAYLRATWHGTNVIFINLILFVVWVIIDGYLLHGSRHHPLLLFATCLAATIPLAYFIGNAVASISAQSSPAIGAVLNATFGSIIEVILYCLALREGKRELVEGAVIGTWLGVLLLLPGVSMIAGGMRFEQLKFNAKSAGVSNTMLIAALVGGFAPTLFYQIFGSFDLECRECHGARCSGCQSVAPAQGSDPVFLHAVVPLSYACAVILPIIYITGLVFSLKTHRKHIYHVPQKDDGGHHTRASSIRSVPTAAAATAAVAQGRRSARGSVRGTPRQNPRDHSQRPSIGSMPPVSMLSLPRPLHGAADRTGGASQAVTASSTLPPAYSQPGGGSAEAPHVTLGPPPQPTIPPIAVAVPTAAPTTNSNDNGHDAPEWSRATSLAVLVACTVLFALIAELLVGTTEAVLHGVPAITEKFLGVTIVALVPSLAEFVNAVAFAMQGNVALSLEIGSAYAVQVALIQVPALVAYSYLRVDGDAFALVFPTWDMQTCFLAVFLLTYVYIEGTANYFKGTILTSAYVVILSGFYYASILPAKLGDPRGSVAWEPMSITVS